MDQLAEAARRGDNDAWTQLFERYQPYLMSVASRVLDNHPPEDCSSVVQASLARGIEQVGQFRGQSQAELLGWLTAIVRNKALDRRRVVKPITPLVTNVDELPCPDTSTPSEQVSRRERAAVLLSALGRLPPDDQEVINLRFFQDLRHQEVATRMGRTNDAVRSLLVRAMRRLRSELGAEI